MTFTVINKRIIAKRRIPPRSRNPHLEQADSPIFIGFDLASIWNLKRGNFFEGHYTVGRRGSCTEIVHCGKGAENENWDFLNRLLSVYDVLDGVWLQYEIWII
ncbi:hypothetical protein TNCV_1176781 [Trichonephila clavipes]|nr:hypothetical protein TNCV_1176781 [Trichonephila clavipes]